MAKTKSNVRKIDWENIYNDMDTGDKKKKFYNNDGYSDNLFVPKLKEDGTYEAIIRFLPRPIDDGSGVPFVKLMHHGFKDVGGWLIENCPTTLEGGRCPICKDNYDNWDTDEQTSRKRGRRTSYFSNIMVVTDPQNPENEGKIFIMKYGKTIHDKILAKIKPKEGSLSPRIDIFDYTEGMNFRLYIRPKSNFNDYSSSEFVGTATSIGDEEKIQEVDSTLYTLGQIVAEDKFKSYDELNDLFLSKTGKMNVSNPKYSEPKKEKVEAKKVEESNSESDDTEESEEPETFFDSLED